MSTPWPGARAAIRSASSSWAPGRGASRWRWPSTGESARPAPCPRSRSSRRPRPCCPATRRAVRRRAARILGRRGVTTMTGAAVSRVERDVVLLASGPRLSADLVVWLAGAAGPGVLAGSGLPLDDRRLPAGRSHAAGGGRRARLGRRRLRDAVRLTRTPRRPACTRSARARCWRGTCEPRSARGRRARTPRRRPSCRSSTPRTGKRASPLARRGQPLPLGLAAQGPHRPPLRPPVPGARMRAGRAGPLRPGWQERGGRRETWLPGRTDRDPRPSVMRLRIWAKVATPPRPARSGATVTA